MTIWAFFPCNGYILPKLISSGIATTTFHQYNHTGMLYFGYKLKITEKYKYVIFRKVKQSKLVITTWKLPSSKVCHGLNNALGICVHEKHYQVLPTQMVPIRENLGLGPWTKWVTAVINLIIDLPDLHQSYLYIHLSDDFILVVGIQQKRPLHVTHVIFPDPTAWIQMVTHFLYFLAKKKADMHAYNIFYLGVRWQCFKNSTRDMCQPNGVYLSLRFRNSSVDLLSHSDLMTPYCNIEHGQHCPR